jgi:hypothetical protein
VSCQGACVLQGLFDRPWTRRLPCQSRARLLLVDCLSCPFCVPFVSLLCPLSRVNPPQSLRYKAKPPLDLGPATPAPGLQSFFQCGPAALMGCSTGRFWYKLSIPGGDCAKSHLGRPWCCINRPNFQENGAFWCIYRAPRPAKMKARAVTTGDR